MLAASVKRALFPVLSTHIHRPAALLRVVTVAAGEAPGTALCLLLDEALRACGFDTAAQGWDRDFPDSLICRAVLLDAPACVARVRCTMQEGQLQVVASLGDSVASELTVPLSAATALNNVCGESRQLWNDVLDKLFAPLRSDACAVAGLPAPPALLSISAPLQREVLQLLTARELATLAVVSHGYGVAAADEELWKALYEAEEVHGFLSPQPTQDRIVASVARLNVGFEMVLPPELYATFLDLSEEKGVSDYATEAGACAIEEGDGYRAAYAAALAEL